MTAQDEKFQTPRRKFRLRDIVLVGIIAIAGLVFGYIKFDKFKEKVQKSEAEIQLSSLFTAEKAFYNEYKHYSKSFKETGFSPEGELRGKLYLDVSEIPQDRLKAIPKDVLPFVGEKSFRAIYVIPMGRFYSISGVDQDGKIWALAGQAN